MRLLLLSVLLFAFGFVAGVLLPGGAPREGRAERVPLAATALQCRTTAAADAGTLQQRAGSRR